MKVHRKSSNSCTSSFQNNPINDDENEIEDLETIDDEATNSHSQNVIFPSEPEDNSTNEAGIFSESRQHKSIMKLVKVILLLLCFMILCITFIRVIIDFKLSKIPNVILFMVFTIFGKLSRTFLVIFSSV